MHRIRVRFVDALPAVLLTASAANLFAADALPIAAERQLFIDDHVVERMQGLTRTLHQPTDIADNPVIVPEYPWEHRRIPFGSVYYSAAEGKFRCWYLAMNIYDSRPGFRGYREEHHLPIQEAAYICYAESDDGVHWHKPKLGLHEFRGSKENNIVLTCPGTHFDSTSVIHTPHDHEQPWKMISFIGLWPYKQELIREQWGDTHFGIQRHGHYAWSSRDGIHWQPLNGGEPVLAANDRSMFWWDPQQKVYVASAKTSRNRKRAQQYARSHDAIHWTKTPDWIHTADARDHPGDEAEAAYGFHYEGQYIGFAEMRRIRPGQPVKINWELLCSRDGRHWTRPLRETFFADGPKESWRYQVLKVFANPPIERDGKLLIYYGGKTGTVSVEEGDEPFQAVCLAELRKDGFVSLAAGPAGGYVITKPLIATGSELRLNVAVREGGHTRVELLDENSQPLPGFELEQCIPVKADGVDQPVSWGSPANLSQLQGKVVRLRIELERADLYSFRFQTRQAAPE